MRSAGLTIPSPGLRPGPKTTLSKLNPAVASLRERTAEAGNTRLPSGRGRAPSLETKFARAELDAVAADGTFSGYASLFGEADLSRDMVMPGAFAASLARRGTAGVRMLFQHDPALPIGVWLTIAEDARGLFVRGRLTKEVGKARDVLALMRAGAIDGLSIGFRTVRARSDAKTRVRRLLEVDLWEISVVTFPLLPAARVGSVKGAELGQLLTAIRSGSRAMRRENSLPLAGRGLGEG